MTSLPIPNPEVLFQPLDDGAVLFAPGTEIYFGLNEVGAQIWKLLPPATRSLEELCSRLATLHPEVPVATIRADAVELFGALVRDDLARHPAPDATDDVAAP